MGTPLGAHFLPTYTPCAQPVKPGKPDVKFTFQDWLQTPEDGLRHEILDGDHVVTPSPSLHHQRISRRIQFQLYEQIELTGRGRALRQGSGRSVRCAG